MTRARAAVLLVVGCAFAAAAAANGPLVGHAEPARGLSFGRLLRLRRERRRLVPGNASGVAHWLDVVVGLVVLVAALAVTAFLLWQFARALIRLRRLRLATGSWRAHSAEYDDEVATGDAETVLHQRVREELAALSADLDTYDDPREAIIACYLRMERAFERDPAESPLELVARVLGEQRVPEPDVRRLTDLFTEARFSGHAVTDDMRAAARRSLAAVTDSLAVHA